jgi:hypothetical protein
MAQYSRLVPQEDVATNEVHKAILKYPGISVGELLDQKLSAARPAIELLLEEGLIRAEVERGQDGIAKRFYPVPMVGLG